MLLPVRNSLSSDCSPESIAVAQAQSNAVAASEARMKRFIAISFTRSDDGKHGRPACDAAGAAIYRNPNSIFREPRAPRRV
jgi:hypothetical protein